MNKLTGKELATFAISKIGTPYVYGAKGADGKFTLSNLEWLSQNYKNVFHILYVAKAHTFIGKVCCDCSGLISWYTGKMLGSSQLYSTASKRGRIKDVASAPVGAVLWKQGHVGVKVDNTYCIEAKGINYGTVKTRIADTKWTHWLLFDYIEYEDVKKINTVHTTPKLKNPYVKPTGLLKKGSKGIWVKWLQFELGEAGFIMSIDGVFGKKTLASVKKFQKSCKLTVDGIVGRKTIQALIGNK